MSSIEIAASVKDIPLRRGSISKTAAMPRGVKNPLWISVSLRLVEIRALCDLSSTTLAERSGVAQSTVIQIENTARTPRIDSVERIACALGIDATWLAFGDEGYDVFNERRRKLVGRSVKPPKPVPGGFACPHAYRELPARLRSAREARGMSLRWVARESNLSAQSLSTTELGTTVPTVENIEAIAKALGVSPGWLAFGIGRGIDGKRYRTREAA